MKYGKEMIEILMNCEAKFEVNGRKCYLLDGILYYAVKDGDGMTAALAVAELVR